MSLFFIYFLLSALNFELFSISLQRKNNPFIILINKSKGNNVQNYGRKMDNRTKWRGAGR